jgi:hypothetical protein
MSSIVLELQKEAMDEQRRVSDCLRKALIVATKLNLGEFRDWIEKELKGYKKDDPIPEYRKVKGVVEFHNPYHGWCPVLFKDSKSKEAFSTRYINQTIGELEELLKGLGPKEKTMIEIPPEILQRAFPEQLELGLVPCLNIGQSEIFGIIETVRNMLLEWSLKLEKDGILGEGLTFSQKEKEIASTINYHIGSFSGVLGNVQSTNLQIGDYNVIHSELKKFGVPQEERNELENILDGLKSADAEGKKSLLKRGSEWLMRNADKIGVLSETIRKWIESYSGQ